MARTTKKTWTPGSIEPLNGKCYFVHDESLMTRVWDMGTLPVPEKKGWRQVTLDEYVTFRRDILTISLKKRKARHALLYKEPPCKSKPVSPLKSNSTSQKALPSKKSEPNASGVSTKRSPATKKVSPSKIK